MQVKADFILSLADASAGLSQVGGKGASLARLAAASLPVPPGFHITTAAYRRFVAEHSLQEQILAAVSVATPDQPATLEEASSRIGKLFAQHVMPDDIAEEIRRAYAGLGKGDVPVAVRSSATAEDLPEMSFAGQQETYLNISGAEAVLEAVKKCWASLWTARAIGYRIQQNVDQDTVELAVVVQQLVPAQAAGVMFTANPFTGQRDQVMISAAWGLGESVVGGTVTPDMLTLDKASGQVTAQDIERYGHRSPHEVELSAPIPSDDPEWFEKKLTDFIRSGVDVEALLARQYAEFSAAWQRFETRFPDRCKTFRRRLELVTAAEKDRESLRSESIRISRLVRRFLLQVGEVTGIGDDVFFLTIDEMVAFLRGDKSSAGLVPARRELYRRYCALPPYPSIIYGRFDPFKWAADPNRRSDFYDARQTGATVLSSTIKGIAGAAGCVEGIVRRIDRVEDGNQLQPGEILVTTITNVGWTPLFPHLAAIITDVGAPLSHAAIVAREIGIPAVVGCGNATMLLKTGDRVRVDGGRGTVEILGSDFGQEE
ncbi:MAG: hypothetical protein JXA33_08700 [Anaerolineae bacterium]|nr:hypothetical protein [Anaerolineae bacterium]